MQTDPDKPRWVIDKDRRVAIDGEPNPRVDRAGVGAARKGVVEDLSLHDVCTGPGAVRLATVAIGMVGDACVDVS